MNPLNTFAEFFGRSFLAAIFLISGLGKLGHYAGTLSYMASAGVPGELLPAVIVLETAGALAVVIGWRTRPAALALAGFSLLAAVIFHTDFQDQIQRILFLKNVAIGGGFLLLFVHGAGPWSLDARRTAALAPATPSK
ncbi:DoxX family protein [Methylococcus sp. ANG]|uniref:DoxX family protein n=1 Tax=unclassified Methylococcus TaxID=2618889 RepID=UPI001C52DAD3|nr:DoxX family protein [Methylococcus sp. Mc7]QXP84475.1 DoxX family protein [Methylococcus sp. Mc7]